MAARYLSAAAGPADRFEAATSSVDRRVSHAARCRRSALNRGRPPVFDYGRVLLTLSAHSHQVDDKPDYASHQTRQHHGNQDQHH